MSEKNKPTYFEIEQQLLELQKLIETEPATPALKGRLISDTEICGALAKIILLAHQQKNYEHISYAATELNNMEQDPTWSNPQLKRKIGHLRKMHTIVIDNSQSAGCMIALLIGCGLSSVSYWLINLI